MININPYIDKLELLKEYMNLWIDNLGVGVWINVESLNTHDFTLEELIDIWQSTGWLICSSKMDENIEPPRKISFEEWLETRTHKAL